MMDPAGSAEALRACLTDAQRIGAISPGGLDDQLVQATGFFADLSTDTEAVVVDLGSGGGLPALPLALAYPRTHWVLVEAWARRAALLRRMVRTLDLADRVTVRAERAELVGHGPLRGTADLVTARSFGPAAVALECAAPLLRPHGEVRISVRGDDAAWPRAALSTLGLGSAVDWQVGPFHYRRCARVADSSGIYPRRPGVPERRPLF